VREQELEQEQGYDFVVGRKSPFFGFINLKI
jgi:hypothetical protein